MPYGTVMTYTRELLEKNAARENISMDQIGLDPNWPECPVCEGDWNIECTVDECEDGYIRPDFLREIAVIYGGALDETFYIDDLYAVNVVDWIAQACLEQAGDSGESWEVILTIPHYEDSTQIYSVSSWDVEQ